MRARSPDEKARKTFRLIGGGILVMIGIAACIVRNCGSPSPEDVVVLPLQVQRVDDLLMVSNQGNESCTDVRVILDGRHRTSEKVTIFVRQNTLIPFDEFFDDKGGRYACDPAKEIEVRVEGRVGGKKGSFTARLQVLLPVEKTAAP
jgi:hypothetical protein